MYSFKNDYSEGAHPRILKVLTDSNLEQTDGYGLDPYCEKAQNLIKERIHRGDADVHFLVGGTQTNLTAISAFLRSHEAAIAAHTGHVLVHETGAIEATGHKVISVESKDGKLRPSQVQLVVDNHTDEHMVKPKLVYISNSTEIGTIYSKKDIEELREVCDKNHLYLYIDGARLGSALMAENNDLTLDYMAKLCDAFYIGGTKGGALLGEALVICNPCLKEDFRYHIKQKGALLAKGRILGIQFSELFKDDLYFKLAKHSNHMAKILKDGIIEAGFQFMIDSPSNQVFPIFPKTLIAKIDEKYSYTLWEDVDGKCSVIRLVTSWATEEEKVREFIEDIKTWKLSET